MSRLIAMSACVVLFGCSVTRPPVVGSRKAKTEQRQVTEFTAIELSVGTAELVVKKGDTASLKLTWDDNLPPLVRTTVVNGVLEIAVERDSPASRRMSPAQK